LFFLHDKRNFRAWQIIGKTIFATRLSKPFGEFLINRRGQISLPRYGGYEMQRALLLQEGVEFNAQDTVDLKKFGW
jgi:hypothetical protein